MEQQVPPSRPPPVPPKPPPIPPKPPAAPILPPPPPPPPTTTTTKKKSSKPRTSRRGSAEPQDLPKDVKCVLVMGFGTLKQIQINRIPRPKPGDGEVLVHVRSCGVTFLDCAIRQGQHPDLPKLPFCPGFECAGDIVQLGANVKGHRVGERVICLPRFFGWSEYLVINYNFVYRIPDEMSFRDAAALPYNYLTAYILLHEIAMVKSGQTVLFHSAAGGVGTALRQLCALVPGLRVIATCSRGKFEAVKDSVHYLVDINAPPNLDYVQEAKKQCPDGVDVVLDCLCGEHTNKGISITKPLGKYILYGTQKNIEGESKNYFAIAKNWLHVEKVSPVKLYEENRSLAGFNLHNYIHQHNTRRHLLDIFAKLFALYRDKQIRPVIDSVHTFEDVATAITKIQERKNVGKILIEPSMDQANYDPHFAKERDSSGGDTEGADDEKDPEDAAVASNVAPVGDE